MRSFHWVQRRGDAFPYSVKIPGRDILWWEQRKLRLSYHYQRLSPSEWRRPASGLSQARRPGLVSRQAAAAPAAMVSSKHSIVVQLGKQIQQCYIKTAINSCND